MANDFIEIRLKNCPADIDYLIKKEQQRLAFHENKDLKKEEVVYQMLREWYKLKSAPPVNEIESKTVETYNGTLNLNTGEVKPR